MKSNRGILKKIFNICIFVFSLLVSIVLLTCLLRPVTAARRNICGYYAEPKDSIDVVFIGGSVTYYSWQPLLAWKEFGFTSYNFCVDALQPQVIKYMMTESQKTQTPKLFVIDIRPFQYGNLYNQEENIQNMYRVAPFRNFSDNMKFSKNRYELIECCAPSLEEKWTYHFDLAKYHSNWKSFICADNWKYILNEKKNHSKGFSYYEDANPIVFQDTTMVRETQELDDKVKAYFVALLNYCKTNNLEVLFLVSPYGNSVDDQKKYNYMENQIDSYGFDFFNANDYTYEMGLDFYKDYYDFDHMNICGSDKFTKYFAQFLDEKYNFADKRESEEYESWNEDYDVWEKSSNDYARCRRKK